MKPVAWYDPSNGAVSTDKNSPLFTPVGQVWPLFSQRTWVGLTDEEIKTIEEMALTKRMAIEMAIAIVKEKF